MIHLGVNIDHVATIRQARYRSGPGASSGYGEPDAVHAAHAAVLGGAECITVHLREDRRHIVDRDVELIRQTCPVKFNLEMAGTAEMQAIALRIKAHQVTLVPEGRQEVTTEGGLAVAGREEHWKTYLAPLKAAGIMTSAFITPDRREIDAAAGCGFDAVEFHTGVFAHAFAASRRDLIDGVTADAPLAAAISALQDAFAACDDRLRVHAGQALNYDNTPALLAVPGVRDAVRELHIGHSIVARAVFVGLERAVREMKSLLAGATFAGA